MKSPFHVQIPDFSVDGLGATSRLVPATVFALRVPGQKESPQNQVTYRTPFVVTSALPATSGKPWHPKKYRIPTPQILNLSVESQINLSPPSTQPIPQKQDEVPLELYKTFGSQKRKSGLKYTRGSQMLQPIIIDVKNELDSAHDNTDEISPYLKTNRFQDPPNLKAKKQFILSQAQLDKHMRQVVNLGGSSASECTTPSLLSRMTTPFLQPKHSPPKFVCLVSSTHQQPQPLWEQTEPINL